MIGAANERPPLTAAAFFAERSFTAERFRFRFALSCFFMAPSSVDDGSLLPSLASWPRVQGKSGSNRVAPGIRDKSSDVVAAWRGVRADGRVKAASRSGA